MPARLAQPGFCNPNSAKFVCREPEIHFSIKSNVCLLDRHWMDDAFSSSSYDVADCSVRIRLNDKIGASSMHDNTIADSEQ